LLAEVGQDIGPLRGRGEVLLVDDDERTPARGGANRLHLLVGYRALVAGDEQQRIGFGKKLFSRAGVRRDRRTEARRVDEIEAAAEELGR